MMYGDMQDIELAGEKVKGFTAIIAFPPKTAIVRLPNADEIAAYLNRYAEQQKAEKKGKTLGEEEKKAPDVELFSKVRLDSGEAFDAYECEYIVSGLTSATVLGCDRDGDAFAVRIKTPFGEVKHVLRAPMLKEMSTYRTAMSRGQQDWGPGNTILALHATMLRRVEGYAEGCAVPPHHKNLAMAEVAVAHYNLDPIQIDPNE